MNIQGYRVEVRELSAHLGGGFVSYAPELKGCVADGENRTDAVLNLEKAMACWLEAAREARRPIPEATPANGQAEGTTYSR